MMRKSIVLWLIVFVFALLSYSSAEEEITITTYYPSPSGNFARLFVSGNVGIGTDSPEAKLDVVFTTDDGKAMKIGNPLDQIDGIYFDKGADVARNWITWHQGSGLADWRVGMTEGSQGGYSLSFYNAGNSAVTPSSPGTEVLRLTGYTGVGNVIIPNGNVGIGTADPQAKLDVNGNIKANLQDIPGSGLGHNQVDWFSGGGPWGREIGYDVAELFDTNEEVEVSDLLVIDEISDIHLKKSYTPYDSKVAGIVSMAPAILFQGSQLEIAPTPGGFVKGTKPPVALSGRVLCKVSIENGAIQPGDLLTSSSTPGHAMKATDREKSFGAIVGKALESFQGGPNGEKTGEIMVIVALQ